MSNLADVIDKAIAIRQGDVVAFKTTRHLATEEIEDMSKILRERLAPLGISWLITAPDIEVTVMRPEDE